MLPFWLKWPYSFKCSSRVVPRAVAPFRSLLLLLQGGRVLHTFHSMDANMATLRIGSTRMYIHPAMALEVMCRFFSSCESETVKKQIAGFHVYLEAKKETQRFRSRTHLFWILSLNVRQLMEVTAKHFKATLLILPHRLP